MTDPPLQKKKKTTVVNVRKVLPISSSRWLFSITIHSLCPQNINCTSSLFMELCPLPADQVLDTACKVYSVYFMGGMEYFLQCLLRCCRTFLCHYNVLSIFFTFCLHFAGHLCNYHSLFVVFLSYHCFSDLCLFRTIVTPDKTGFSQLCKDIVQLSGNQLGVL